MTPSPQQPRHDDCIACGTHDQNCNISLHYKAMRKRELPLSIPFVHTCSEPKEVQPVGQWVEELEVERLERLFFLLKMAHLAKDPKAHMNEVRGEVAALKSFIRSLLQKERERAIVDQFNNDVVRMREQYELGKKEERERIVALLRQEESDKWDDAVHCSCLPAAIEEIIGITDEK